MYQPLRLTLVDRFHPFLRFSLANFRRLSSPFVSKTQKLPSRTRRPKKELRSQKKKKQPSFLPHKEQKTSSVSKQNAVAHVYQPHGTFIAFLFSFARMWFQNADFAFAFGLPLAVLTRVIWALFFFFRLRKADWLRFSRHPSILACTTRRRRAFSVSRSFRSASSDVFAKKRYRLVLFGRSFDGLRGVRPLRAEMDFI